jgi:hypothetical protein
MVCVSSDAGQNLFRNVVKRVDIATGRVTVVRERQEANAVRGPAPAPPRF